MRKTASWTTDDIAKGIGIYFCTFLCAVLMWWAFHKWQIGLATWMLSLLGYRMEGRIKRIDEEVRK